MAVKLKSRGGRVQSPKLDYGALTGIGNELVKAQKARWKSAVNAAGQPAKKLAVRSFFQKRAFFGGGSPKRDNRMTGALVKNFTLRKAINGVIRAENTSRIGRNHAQRAQGYEEMIGFAGSDVKATMQASELAYGRYMTKAWIPL